MGLSSSALLYFQISRTLIFDKSPNGCYLSNGEIKKLDVGYLKSRHRL